MQNVPRNATGMYCQPSDPYYQQSQVTNYCFGHKKGVLKKCSEKKIEKKYVPKNFGKSGPEGPHYLQYDGNFF